LIIESDFNLSNECINRIAIHNGAVDVDRHAAACGVVQLSIDLLRALSTLRDYKLASV
jgi:hypothetical protein